MLDKNEMESQIEKAIDFRNETCSECSEEHSIQEANINFKNLLILNTSNIEISEYESNKLPLSITIKGKTHNLFALLGSFARYYYTSYSYSPLFKQWVRIPSRTYGKKVDYLNDIHENLKVDYLFYTAADVNQ